MIWIIEVARILGKKKINYDFDNTLRWII